MGYSPRGHKESDVTKQLSLHFTSLLMFMAGFPAGSVIKNPLAIQETLVRSLGQEVPLEKG